MSLARIRNVLIVGILILVLLFSIAYYAKIGPFQTTLTFTSQNTTYSASSWSYSFSLDINYSGSWHLAYWGVSGTVSLDNVTGDNLNGTGNYENTITLHGMENTMSELCASATKLSSDNVTLELAVSAFTNSTSTSNKSAEVCVQVAH